MADDPTQKTLDLWERISAGVDELAAKVGDERRDRELEPLPEEAPAAVQEPPAT